MEGEHTDQWSFWGRVSKPGSPTVMWMGKKVASVRTSTAVSVRTRSWKDSGRGHCGHDSVVFDSRFLSCLLWRTVMGVVG